MPAFETLITIATASVGGLGALLATVPEKLPDSIPMSPAVRDAINQAASVMDGGRTMGFCIAGACCGALVSICFTDSITHKELARKLLASTLSSVLFSPQIMEWWGMTPTTTHILFMSGGFALLAWTLIQIVLAKAGPAFTAWFSGRLPPMPQPQPTNIIQP